MKFSVNQSELNEVLGTLLKAVSGNPMYHALAGVRINTDEGMIVLQTTNLDLSIEVKLPALIEGEGEAIIPAKLFSNIVKALPNEAIKVDVTDAEAQISCGASKFKIRTFDSLDFPMFPHIETSQSVKLPYDAFANMAKKASKMVAKEEQQAILQGVLFNIKDNKMKMVGIDGYRVLVAEEKLEEQVDDFEAVILGTILQDVANSFKNVDEVSIALSENQIVITCGNTVFVSRRIAGDYPQYEKFFETSYRKKVKIRKDKLIDAVRRINVLSSNRPVVKFIFNTDDSSVTLRGSEEDVGSAKEKIDCEYDSQSEQGHFEECFNCVYVAEGLSCIDSEYIYMEVNEPLQPATFKDEEDGKLEYLLLAINPRM